MVNHGLIPATRFLSNTPGLQLAHVMQEMWEVEKAFWDWTKERNPETLAHLAEELVDLQTSAETMLAILGLDDEQRRRVRERVQIKNAMRGYYEAAP